MIFPMQGWMRFLASDLSVYGIPFILLGLALMVFGWRMWKVCVVLSFGLIGAVLGSYVGDPGDSGSWFPVVGGVLFGALSYRLAHHAVAVMGGLVGTGLVASVLSSAGQSSPLLWAGSGVGFVVGCGLAFLNRPYVVVFVTSIFGAVLLVSGLTAAVMKSSAMYNSLHHITSSSVVVVPFLILVPTVMSCFLQASEIRRFQPELHK